MLHDRRLAESVTEEADQPSFYTTCPLNEYRRVRILHNSAVALDRYVTSLDGAVLCTSHRGASRRIHTIIQKPLISERVSNTATHFHDRTSRTIPLSPIPEP
jgi:hypothetical protein